MDNLTHTLVGAALGRAGLERRSPLAMPTLLIAANLPDVDALSGFWGPLSYLDHHRGFTHSLAGVLCEAPLLAGAMLIYGRCRRNASAAPPLRFWNLLLVALCGVASHPLLDYTNSYGLRPWLPFAAGWVYGDLVFIVDPLIWLLLGGALVLGTGRRAGLAGWGVLAALLSTALLGSARVPVAMKLLWCGLILALAAARGAGVWSPRRAGRLALLGLVVYWVALAGLHARALSLARHGAPAGRLAALPVLGTPFRWHAYVRTPQTIYMRSVTLLGKPRPVAWQAVKRHLDTPAVQRAVATDDGCVMRGFARYLVADIVGSGGARAVVLRDLRFGPPRGGGFASVRIGLPPARR